jgi:hypothetical protein
MRLFRNGWGSTAVATIAVLCAFPWAGKPAEARPWQPEIISTKPVPVSVESPNQAVRDDLKGMIEVTVKRARPSYDDVTGQARWPHWIGLENKSRKYDLHLTLLERHVKNGLELRFGADAAAAVSRREFRLDVLRATLHVDRLAPSLDGQQPKFGHVVWFPCAESISRPGPRGERDWHGTYSVWRTYTGDVTWEPATGSKESGFAPVKISFRIEFDLLDNARAFGPETMVEGTPRRVEWGWLSDRCDTCRGVVMCESLWRPGPFELASLTTFKKSTSTSGPKHRVHVVVGLEKRSVSVDPGVAEHRRTVFCSFWSGKNGATLAPIVTDGTEVGLADEAPYLTFHHAVPTETMASRENPWTVEVRTGEVSDLSPGPPANESWAEWEKRLLNTCTTTVWRGRFEVE